MAFTYSVPLPVCAVAIVVKATCKFFIQDCIENFILYTRVNLNFLSDCFQFFKMLGAMYCVGRVAQSV
jgi:hypothetical protein